MWCNNYLSEMVRSLNQKYQSKERKKDVRSWKNAHPPNICLFINTHTHSLRSLAPLLNVQMMLRDSLRKSLFKKWQWSRHFFCTRGKETSANTVDVLKNTFTQKSYHSISSEICACLEILPGTITTTTMMKAQEIRARNACPHNALCPPCPAQKGICL